MTDWIAVIDFGGQYCHLIARRVRQLGVYSQIIEPEESEERLKGAKGIILSGGPHSVFEEQAPKFNARMLQSGLPVLGLCYGHQLLVYELGGSVAPGQASKEYGKAQLSVKSQAGIFEGLEAEETVWMSHGDSVQGLPKGFEVLGSTPDCQYAAIGNQEKNFYGLQFHPEVTHTPHGMKVLENFLFKTCQAKKEWDLGDYLERQTEEIRKRVGEKKVFLLASGGVDSNVVFAMLNKALPQDKVYGLHVDTGFMRKNESEEVKEAFEKLGYKNFHVVDAEDFFLEKVKGLIDPEEKRKAIGEAFLEIKAKEMKRIGLNEDEWLLAQGTIYPDTIETARTKHASKIKTHHNRVPVILELIEQGKVLEPVDELYKDEVRELGRLLNLPDDLIWRHPFPGPGLAIRCLCAEKEDYPPDLEKVEARANEIAAWYNLSAKVLPVKSVGVQGDSRTYRNPVALSGEADWEILEEVSTKLTNKVKEINRVVYALNVEEVKTVDVVPNSLTKPRLDLLREVDAIVHEAVEKKGLMKEIWQFPVILLPLDINQSGKESIVLRPIHSTEAMTARFAPLPEEVLDEIKEKIKPLKVGALFFDITHKPPGTICWE